MIRLTPSCLVSNIGIGNKPKRAKNGNWKNSRMMPAANTAIPGQTEFLGVRKPGLLFICVIYFIGAYAMSKYSQRLEKQLGVGER